MKARVMMIGDYDDQSKTYAICLIADESEVDASPLKEGDEVEVNIANAPHQALAVASRPECGCSVWPCPTCGAVDMEDAGNKCKADWVCAADDQRQRDYEREQSTPNNN